MRWSSLLVHIRAYESWSPSIDVALLLAKTFDARLTGLYTIRELAILKLMLGANHPAVREAETRDEPLTAAMQAKFEEACARAGVSAEWDLAEGNAQEVLSLAGRCHDLVIIEQSLSGLDRLGTDIVEECAVSCGTPTMIVPRSGAFASVGRHVVVAWNHSRQSASALHAALPLIAKAEKVTILLGEQRDPASSITKAPRHDIEGYVRNYARNVSVVPFASTETDNGTELLGAARKAGGDVLVMGAYGRSAWREFVLGGATRSVIRHLDKPVLMAH